MKISKRPVTASIDPVAPGEGVAGLPQDAAVVGQPSSVAMADCPYEQAKCYIQSAIGALTNVAAEDPVAKDSIANLAVVLLDLQGSCK